MLLLLQHLLQLYEPVYKALAGGFADLAEDCQSIDLLKDDAKFAGNRAALKNIIEKYDNEDVENSLDPSDILAAKIVNQIKKGLAFEALAQNNDADFGEMAKRELAVCKTKIAKHIDEAKECEDGVRSEDNPEIEDISEND